jgi:hypothetical protein
MRHLFSVEDDAEDANASGRQLKQRPRRSQSELRGAILEALAHGDYSQNELAVKLGYAKAHEALQKVVGELISQNVIGYTANGKSPTTKLTHLAKQMDSEKG